MRLTKIWAQRWIMPIHGLIFPDNLMDSSRIWKKKQTCFRPSKIFLDPLNHRPFPGVFGV